MTVHTVLIITCKRLKYCVIYCLGGDYFINCHFWPFFLSLGSSFALLPPAKLKMQHWASRGSLKAPTQPVFACGARPGPSEGTALLYAVTCSGCLGLQAIAARAHDSSSPQGPQPACPSYLLRSGEGEAWDRDPRSCKSRPGAQGHQEETMPWSLGQVQPQHHGYTSTRAGWG